MTSTGITVLCSWPDCLAASEGSLQALQAAGWEVQPPPGTRAWCPEHVPPF